MTLSTYVRRVSATAAAGLVAGLVAVPALTTPASAVPTAPETGCVAYSAPTTLDSTDAAVPIPGTDNIAEQTIDVTDPGRIAWVRVHTDIDHAYSYDVDAILVTPSGTEITLTRQNAGSLDDVFSDTWFDDDAPSRRWARPTPAGSRRRCWHPRRHSATPVARSPAAPGRCALSTSSRRRTTAP